MTTTSVKTSARSIAPLGKFLASSEKSVRDKAVAALSNFLSARKTDAEPEGALEIGELNWETESKLDSRLQPLELAILWQGIFYCFWMSDKPLVQQALASHLASLLLDVRPKVSKKHPERQGRVGRVRNALAFLKGFWETVIKEWTGLDILRLDKFYLLIRRFVGASFQLLAREEWDLDAIAAYNAVLTGPNGPLSVLDTKVPHSLAYHLSDIYIEELERSLPLFDSATTPDRIVPLTALLSPFLTTLTLAPSKTMFERVVDNIFKPLITELIEVESVGEPKTKKRKTVESSEREFSRIAAYSVSIDGETLSEGILKTIFEEGGKETTGEVNRRRMYALSRGFE